MKLKVSKPKFKFNLKWGLIFATVVILLVEAYYAYNYLYNNLTVGPVVAQADKIVRVDNESYKTTINYLHSLPLYTPVITVPTNSNPLK